MRTLRLARVAAEAERLRLRRTIRRVAVRAVLGVVAAVFLLIALTLGHLAAWLALVRALPPIGAALILAAADIIIAAILAVFASRGVPDRLAVESRLIRDQALAEIKTTFSLFILVRTAARVLREVRRRV
jgi:hypothetical protein